MILPDVNVLVHAFRADSGDHERCREWLFGVLNGESRYAMSPQVLSSVIRLTTHPRVFREPSERGEAVRFCESLLDPPQSVVARPGDAHWSIFLRLCEAADARGNLVPDAWFAALAVESGCEWITLDRDYARFPGLKWSAPAAPG